MKQRITHSLCGPSKGKVNPTGLLEDRAEAEKKKKNGERGHAVRQREPDLEQLLAGPAGLGPGAQDLLGPFCDNFDMESDDTSSGEFQAYMS